QTQHGHSRKAPGRRPGGGPRPANGLFQRHSGGGELIHLVQVRTRLSAEPPPPDAGNGADGRAERAHHEVKHLLAANLGAFPATTTKESTPPSSTDPMTPRPSGSDSLKSAMRMVLHPGRPGGYFFVCPRAKMLATKLNTSVAQMSQYP